MADPGTSLSPDELDRLEDALERWTDPAFEPGPEDSLLDGSLRERLAGYREVLATTREALPLEDVGDDVLAGVLAEAHRAAPTRRAASQGPGLWERLRRSLLLPGVALAGSAALLLWLVQPSPEMSLSAAQDDAPAAREEARLAPEAGPAPAAPLAPEPEAQDKDAMPAPSAGSAKAEAPADMPGSAGPKDMDDVKVDRKAKPVAPSRKAESSAPLPLPGLDETAPLEEADKEELRDTLERADQSRRSGDCDAAMSDYLVAMNMGGAATERSQARAGYAMCLQQRGEEAKAAKYIEMARKLWPGVDGWMSREGGEMMKKPKSKAPPSKPKKALADPAI